jgi:hypothetical protein
MVPEVRLVPLESVVPTYSHGNWADLLMLVSGSGPRRSYGASLRGRWHVPVHRPKAVAVAKSLFQEPANFSHKVNLKETLRLPGG